MDNICKYLLNDKIYRKLKSNTQKEMYIQEYLNSIAAVKFLKDLKPIRERTDYLILKQPSKPKPTFKPKSDVYQCSCGCNKGNFNWAKDEVWCVECMEEKGLHPEPFPKGMNPTYYNSEEYIQDKSNYQIHLEYEQIKNKLLKDDAYHLLKPDEKLAYLKSLNATDPEILQIYIDEEYDEQN